MNYQYEIFYSILFYSLAAIFSIAVNVVFYFRARKSELLTAFMSVQAIMVIWLIAKILKKSAPNNEVAWLWVAVQYIAVCFFGPLFLNFSHLYKQGRPLKKWFYSLLISIACINYLMVFTNPIHQLFFTSVTIFESHYGPWFYIHTVFTYICIAISYLYLIRALLKGEYHVPLLQALLFNIGLILPIISNVVYVFHLIKFSFDITPIMYNLTVIIFGYSAYRYRFLDIKKVTRNMVLDNIHEGIIIIDVNNRIVLQNNVIKDIIHNYLEIEKVEKISDFLHKVDNQILEYDLIKERIQQCIANKDERMIMEFSMIVHGGIRGYILKLEKIEDHAGDFVGYVFRFIDVTKHRELVQNLEEKNEALIKINKQLSENVSAAKQLAVAKERSRISKEIHDILGHSVTVVISLLEIGRQNIHEDRVFSREKVTQSMDIIRSGLVELKKSIKKHSKDVIEASKLNQDISKLIVDYEQAGVMVDYYYKDAEVNLSTQVYDTIYRICQEGLTNALRHGKAKQVTLGLRYVERHIDLFIIDDGRGCHEVVMGNGLKGMENRVQELGGFFSCGSPDGEGFNIHVTLPFQ